jgi:hypothetical protein
MDTNKLFWIGLLLNVLLIGLLGTWPSSWLEVVVGALTSIWVTVLVESIRKPDLKLELYPVQEGWRAEGRPGDVRQLRLVNRPLPAYLSWLQRSPAVNTSGTIVFHRLGSGVASNPMPIRWSNTAQLSRRFTELTFGNPPVTKIILDPERLVVTQQIPPGFSDDGVFGVAARFCSESDAYGVTNESYFTHWKPPDWHLAQGRYRVDVRINAENGTCKGTFLLVNENSSPDGFRLEEWTKD